MIRFCFIAFTILFWSCQNKPTPEVQEKVLALKTMGQLASSEYLVSKIVKASDNKTWFKFGNRKILLSCEASIKAGIDLTELKPENINLSGQNIILYLPAPKILTVSIPPDKVKLELEEIGLLRSHFNNDEQNKLMIQAEQEIRRVADSIGVIKSAGENAEIFLRSYLRNLGFKDVSIKYGEPEKTKKLD